MNRQERFAYERGWTARCLGLALSDVPRTVDRDDVVVEMSDQFERHLRWGYEDAICRCGHDEWTHARGYGCKGVRSDEGEAQEGEEEECPCTGFVSASLERRTEAFRKSAGRQAVERDAKGRPKLTVIRGEG